jgi:hypothetical protein
MNIPSCPCALHSTLNSTILISPSINKHMIVYHSSNIWFKYTNHESLARSGVDTSAHMSTAIFLYFTPYSLVDGYHYFGGTYCLRTHSRTGSSETGGGMCLRTIWLTIYKTTRRHVPKYNNLHKVLN